MKRAAVYARISETSKVADKVADQEAQCRALAKREGLEVVEVYADDGISASKFLDRPGWTDLLGDIEQGRFDVILATEEERFTRQPLEKEALTVACISAGVTWHTVRDGYVDPSTDSGAFLSGLRALMGRMESRRKATRQVASNEARARRGEQVSKAQRPFGWEPDFKTLREPEATMIREGAEALCNGASVQSLIKEWNRSGVSTPRGKVWAQGSVQHVLKRARNAGLVERHGAVLEGVKGQWEAVLSPEQHAAVVAILTDSTRQVFPRREPYSLLTSIAVCTCGSVMRSSTQQYRGERVPSLVCAARHSGLAPEVKHATVRASIADLAATRAVAAAFLFAPKIAFEGGLDNKIADLLVELSYVRAQKDSLMDSLVPGFEAQFQRKAQMLAEQERQAVERLELVRRQDANAAMLVASREAVVGDVHSSFDDAATAKRVLQRRFLELPLVQRRILVRSLLHVTILAGRSEPKVDIHHLVATSLNWDDESNAIDW